MSDKGEEDEVKSEIEEETKPTKEETKKETPKEEPVKEDPPKQEPVTKSEPPKQEKKEEKKKEEPVKETPRDEEDYDDTELKISDDKGLTSSISSDGSRLAEDRKDKEEDIRLDDIEENDKKDESNDNSNEQKDVSIDKSDEHNSTEKVKTGKDFSGTETVESESERMQTSTSSTDGEKDKSQEKVDEKTKSEVAEKNEINDKNNENVDEQKGDTEKPKDEYIPLDVLWSSPKREFKGVQGDYSFKSKRSFLSPSSTADSSSRKDESKISVNENEANKDDKKESSEENADIKEENEERVDLKQSNTLNESKVSDDSKENDDKLDIEKEGKNEDEKDKLNYSDDEKVSEKEKEEEEDITLKPFLQTKKDEEVKDYSSDEDHDKATKQEHEDHREKSSFSEKKEETKVPSSPRRSRDRYDSDSSRSLSGSPRRSPPPTEMKWEKEEEVAEKEEEDKYQDEKFDSEGSEAETKEKEEKEQTIEQEKSSGKEAADKSSDRKQQESSGKDRAISPRQIMATERRTQRPGAQSADVKRESVSKDSPRALSPAQAKSPRSSYIRYSPTQKPKPKPRPRTTCGGRSIGNKKRLRKSLNSRKGMAASEEGRTKQKEFFKAELQRLEKSLGKESTKISRPKQRAYYPFVWTSLEPYYNTYVARYLINVSDNNEGGRPISRGKLYNEKSPNQRQAGNKKSWNKAEDPRPGFVSRNTAIGLCDPWTDLKMDRDLLPRLETPAKSKRRQQQEAKDAGARKDKKGKKPPKEGSTRLPKFPIVDFNTQKENATKQFPYYEVPKFREGMKGRYGIAAPKKVESDYIRTRQDFYRMDLDRLDEVHPLNRSHMRKAYFAYLQNTPGSKKAIKECVKNLNEGDKPNQEMTSQQAQKAN